MGPAREAALPPSRPAGELGREGLLPPGGVQGGRDWGRCAVVVDATPFPLDPNPNPQVLTPEGKREVEAHLVAPLGDGGHQPAW